MKTTKLLTNEQAINFYQWVDKHFWKQEKRISLSLTIEYLNKLINNTPKLLNEWKTIAQQLRANGEVLAGLTSKRILRSRIMEELGFTF